MRIINYILSGFLFLGALACQEDRHDVEGGGRIRLSLTDRVFTKALPDALTVFGGNGQERGPSHGVSWFLYRF